MFRKYTLAIAISLLLIPPSFAGGGGIWESIPVFSREPLEAKLGVFSEGPDPDALGMVLWNDGSNNRLDAITIPPPYDGTGVTVRGLEITPTLFALGDICTVGDQVVVPYIKDFNIQTARYDGSNWTFLTIPETVTNNFDSADCVVTQAGILVAGHDLTDSETELFRSTDSGSSFTFYERYGNVAGPFDGSMREPLATTFGSRYAVGLNQRMDGQIRATRIDTAQNPPAITHTNVTQTAPPPGSFQFVKESSARSVGDEIYFTYNVDGNIRLAIVPVNDPAQFVSMVLDALASGGSQFSFVTGGLLPLFDVNTAATIVYLYWLNLSVYDARFKNSGTVDTSYPLDGVGGPVDACLLSNNRGEQHAVFIGPRVGSMGTDLHIRTLETGNLFTDGFETSDRSVFTQCE